MTKTPNTRSRHLRGLGRLAAEATLGVTELVEAVHQTISAGPGPPGAPPGGSTSGLTGVVYGNVRGVTRLVGSGVEAALAKLAPLVDDAQTPTGRDGVLAALNGVLGDYLEESGNPLAIPMHLRRNGRPVEHGEQALSAGFSQNPGRTVLLVHGLCVNDEEWTREGHNHGAALERDLGLAPVYLRYNSGRHVSTNGRDLSRLLETFLASGSAPPPELTILALSLIHI